MYTFTCCGVKLVRPIFKQLHVRYNSYQYCHDLVRKRDHNNYLALLLLPAEMRTVGMVAHAFNIELAQIQQQTSEVATAKARLEFWRTSLEDTYRGYPPAHPVLISLALCLEKSMVSNKWFDRFINIRKQHLSDLPFMTLHDAEEYGEYTVSTLFYILLEQLQCNNASAEHAASHLGKACSLVTLIRSVPYFIQNKKVFLPTELCYHHSVSNEDVIRNNNTTGVREVIYDTASQAFIHLEHVHKALPDLPVDCRRLLLPRVSCDMFLEHLRQLDFDVYNSDLNRKQWMLPLKLFIAYLKTNR